MPLVGQLETALALRDGAGEGAFLVAEQFRFQHAFRQRGAIEFDEGTRGAAGQIVHRLREQFLPGARFAAQDHGGIGARDDADHVQHAANFSAFADDAAFRLVRAAAARHRVRHDLGAQFRQPALFFQQPGAIVGDDPMQPHRLADQVGDHFQKSQILIDLHFAPFQPGAIDRQRADHAVAVLDRHAHERIVEPRRAPCGSVPVEDGVLADVRHRQRDLRRHQLADHTFGQRVEIAPRAGPAKRARDHHLGLTGIRRAGRSGRCPCRGSFSAR